MPRRTRSSGPFTGVSGILLGLHDRTSKIDRRERRHTVYLVKAKPSHLVLIDCYKNEVGYSHACVILNCFVLCRKIELMAWQPLLITRSWFPRFANSSIWWGRIEVGLRRQLLHTTDHIPISIFRVKNNETITFTSQAQSGCVGFLSLSWRRRSGALW